MRIFVGYHFGPDDTWVRDQVYRLITAFRSDYATGESLYLANQLSQGVIDRINECDGLIGIATRNGDAKPNGGFETYPWVQDELTTAQVAGKLWVQIRETRLDPNLGMHEGKQYIPYDRAQPAECLVRLAEALGEWHAPRDVFVYFVPTEFAATIRPFLNRDGFRCTCEVLDDYHKRVWHDEVKIVPVMNQMQVKLRGVSPLGRFIQFRAAFGPDVWESDFETVNSRTMTMRKL